MSGLTTLAKFGYLSDENRWAANRYNFEWLSELDQHDRDTVKLLDCLRDGEFSGQASATQLYELVLEAKKAGYPRELLADWSPLYSYINIIVYEELRHGIVLGTLHHYVTTGKTDYIEQLEVREFGERYMWCYDDRRYWDLYSYILTHLFSEIINTELYRDVATRAHHPELKSTLAHIRNDEARHIAAWTALIKDLLQADERHMQSALQSLDRGMLYHNAMVHETYFEGVHKMLPLFLSEKADKMEPLKRITKQKCRVMAELFGERNPYTEKDIQDMHLNFLMSSSGYTRARYSEELPGNIEFATV